MDESPKHLTDAQHQQLAGMLATELAQVIPPRFFDGAFTFEGHRMDAPRGTPRALVILAVQVMQSMGELGGIPWDSEMLARTMYVWARAYLDLPAPSAPAAGN